MQLNIDTVIPIKNHIRHDASFKHNNFASKPHFLFFLILAGLIVFSRGENLLSAELSLNTFSYHEDFEEKDPFEFWTSNGSYKVNYKGLDSTKSSSNAASFKLDITLETATYVYWKIPVKIPSAGELYFKGDIYVDTTSNAEIALGTNVSFSPCPHSGVNILERLDQPTGIWETQESDLISYGNKKAEDIVQKYCGGATEADVGAWTDKIGLYIFSSQGGRIVVYVDNIEIKGMIPELSAYTSYCDNLWQSYIDRVNTEISEITSQIAGINEESLSCSQGQIFIRDAKTDIEEIKTNVKKNGYPSPEEYYEVKDIEILTNYICNETDGQSMTVYPWKPITTRKILPHTYPVPASPDNILSIQGCRGEFEPAAFVIRAAKDISSIQVEASDLDGPNNQKIASGNIDIRLVKCWYQAGEETRYNTGEKVLVPELLLKDDELVSVDFSAKQNALRVTIDGKEQYIDISSPDAIIPDNAIIKDSDTLKPFNLSANTNKQVWLTLEIPEDCIAGDYEGKIFVKDSKSILSELLLKVKVFPFELQAPDLDYAIYYRGKLKADENEIVGINSEWKTSDQYEIELLNMKNHGIDYPTIYQGLNDELVSKALTIREKTNLPQNRLYVLGTTTGNPTTEEKLAALEKNVKRWVGLATPHGYTNIFIYGIDEASGDELLSQRDAWQKVKESGAKIFVACYSGAVDLMGDLLDLPVMNGCNDFNLSDIEKWHAYGKPVFTYGNPQVGIENPVIYRQNFGIGLWCIGYDGAMDYAYQHSFGHIWNDFDHKTYRDHVFSYPTSNGLIDTVQWEGFREAVDDIRYLTTFFTRSPESRSDSEFREALSVLLKNNENDMGNARNNIIEKILAFSQVTAPKFIDIKQIH